MEESPALRLERAGPDAAPLLANLLELYVHDMSEFLPLEVGPDGRYGYPWLALYWSEPEARHAFLLRRGETLLGFALATRGSPASDDPDVLDVAEFFILRRHRRGGLGRQAAFALWDALPGRWTVRVSEANRAGLPFWRATVGAYTAGAYQEEARPGSPHAWRVFHFDAAPARAKRGPGAA